jgi:hypothetical protein
MDSLKSDYIRTLRRLPLFTDLSDAELALVAESVSRLYFEEGTLICGEGDVCRELLIVEAGTVKIFKSALKGRQQLLSIERKGSSLADVGPNTPIKGQAAGQRRRCHTWKTRLHGDRVIEAAKCRVRSCLS